MSITKRDRQLVNLLDNQLKCITTSQVNKLPYFNCDNSATSRRLRKITVEYKFLQRQMMEVVNNTYVYWSIHDKYLPKQLEHSLKMTDVYLALVRTGYEIITFDIETGLKYNENNKDKIIIPDIMITAKSPVGRIESFFCEICLDKKIEDIKKKYNIYKNYYVPQVKKLGKNISPKQLLVISDIAFTLDDGITIGTDLDEMESFFKFLSIG